jgi:uncharacterized protein (DUF58 family)
MAAPAAPARPLLDPAVLARIGSLELVARTVVDGFVGGLHRSPALGSTTDFAEHRGYMPGDDVRRVDWRLYARTDRLHVKEFEAETNAGAAVLLDVSRSMAYGSGAGGLTKLDYGRYLAASLLWLARRQHDRVALATFDAALRDFVPPSGRHLPHVLRALERAAPGGAGELAGPLREAARHLTRRGIVVVISDLYAEPAAAVDAVRRLRGAGNEVLLFHVLDPAELAFPFTEPGGFEDAETGETITVVPAGARARYQERVRAHVAELGRLARAQGVDYALFDTGRPLDHALSRYLAGRERLARGGRPPGVGRPDVGRAGAGAPGVRQAP